MRQRHASAVRCAACRRLQCCRGSSSREGGGVLLGRARVQRQTFYSMRALALAALAVTATAAPLTLMKHHERHVERRRGAALAAHGEAPLPPAQFFSQVLSHFDGVVAADPTKMWPQRFW